MAENKKRWQPVPVDPPKLTTNQWYGLGVLGIVFLVAGILQLISFADFSDNLAAMGLSAPRLWASLIILGELWAAVSFFKLRLSPAFRFVSNFWALIVSLFWFYESIRQAAMAPDEAYPISSMGYFGRFISQAPGWWTVLEATLLAFGVLYMLSVSKAKMPRKRK